MREPVAVPTATVRCRKRALRMRESGMRARTVMATWTVCALLLAGAVVAGRVTVDQLSPHVLAVALAFAGGAVLASLADTLMPEAFEHGRPYNLCTAAGVRPGTSKPGQ